MKRKDGDTLTVQMMYQLVLLAAHSLCIGSVVTRHLPASFETSSQAILSNLNYTLRNAIREDIDDITTVVIDAFSPGLAWQYVRPEYENFKNYTWHCTRAALAQQWDEISTDTNFIKVVTIPDTQTSDGRNERVVALGIWKLLARNDTMNRGMESFLQVLQNSTPTWEGQLDSSHSGTKYNCSAHLDTNQTRATDADWQLNAAKDQYIDKAYPRQLYLNTLATHPDWDGNGFAALNLDWGIGLAKTLGEPVTLIATPTGYLLYNHIGFRSLKNISIEMLDGWQGEPLWFEVMEYP